MLSAEQNLANRKVVLRLISQKGLFCILIPLHPVNIFPIEHFFILVFQPHLFVLPQMLIEC